MAKQGEIYRVAGPVVTATGISPKMYDIMQVGEEGLMGEVIKIDGDKTIIQVYEETSGLKPGEKVIDTAQPPGGRARARPPEQRVRWYPEAPSSLDEQDGRLHQEGRSAPRVGPLQEVALHPGRQEGRQRRTRHHPGTVQEFYITHKIMVPPGVSGTLTSINEGDFTVDETIATVGNRNLTMLQKWPVRSGRPFGKKLLPDIPLVTGQRVLDTMFPLPQGGTAAIPGAFGTGKTVTQQQLAKWSDAEIVVTSAAASAATEMTEFWRPSPSWRTPRPVAPDAEDRAHRQHLQHARGRP
jgi:V/A-type H+-transporting ATPase subunit A